MSFSNDLLSPTSVSFFSRPYSPSRAAFCPENEVEPLRSDVSFEDCMTDYLNPDSINVHPDNAFSDVFDDFMKALNDHYGYAPKSSGALDWDYAPYKPAAAANVSNAFTTGPRGEPVRVGSGGLGGLGGLGKRSHDDFDDECYEVFAELFPEEMHRSFWAGTPNAPEYVPKKKMRIEEEEDDDTDGSSTSEDGEEVEEDAEEEGAGAEPEAPKVHVFHLAIREKKTA